MALGDVNNYNSNKEKKYTPTVYSNYTMSNVDSTVDVTKLEPYYWNGLLALAIVPLKKDGDKYRGDRDNSVTVFLTHTKARMLSEEINAFMQNPNAFNNQGVPTGAGLITISNGKEFGVSTPCLSIRKINAETGQVECSAAYQFKTDAHYAIRNFDEKSTDFDKFVYGNIEIDALQTLLISYYEAMTGAVAYSVIDHNKFNQTRTYNSLNSITEKLGISTGNSGQKKYNNTSIFNNKEPRNSSSNFSQSSIDDIEEQMG